MTINEHLLTLILFICDDLTLTYIDFLCPTKHLLAHDLLYTGTLYFGSTSVKAISLNICQKSVTSHELCNELRQNRLKSESVQLTPNSQRSNISTQVHGLSNMPTICPRFTVRVSLWEEMYWHDSSLRAVSNYHLEPVGQPSAPVNGDNSNNSQTLRDNSKVYLLKYWVNFPVLGLKMITSTRTTSSHSPPPKWTTIFWDNPSHPGTSRRHVLPVPLS